MAKIFIQFYHSFLLYHANKINLAQCSKTILISSVRPIKSSFLHFQCNRNYNDIMSETKKDEVVDHFNTYEDYLNMFVTEEDMLYLGEEEIAR